METTSITINTIWTDTAITDSDAKWIIQNTGSYAIEVIYTDGSSPECNDKGMVISPGEGLVSSIHGTGNIWAKSMTSTYGKLSITK